MNNKKQTRLQHNNFVCRGPNMVFRFKCYNLPFSGGGMVMWTNTHCLNIFFM